MKLARAASSMIALLLAFSIGIPAGSTLESGKVSPSETLSGAECLGVADAKLILHPIVASHNPADLAPCQGIRPGGALILRAGPFELLYCTMSFIVADRTNPNAIELFVATAGHCVDPDLGVPGPGQRVSAHGVPGTFGTVAYQWCEGADALGNGCAPGTDFALIEIDSDKYGYVNTAMCHWGAPSGMFDAFDENLRELRHFGWGYGYGNLGGIGLNGGGIFVQPANPATQGRSHVGLDFSADNYVFGYGPALSGDSGSGVLVTELPDLPSLSQPAPQALGVLTHIAVGGFIFVQRLDTSLAKASQDLGRSFSLATEADS